MIRAVAITVAIIGGAFVGLFSCGAYSWQTPLVLLIIALITLLAVVLRIRARGFSLWRSIGFVALIVASYFFSEAVAAPFYPAAPASFSEFLRSFVRTLESGPC